MKSVSRASLSSLNEKCDSQVGDLYLEIMEDELAQLSIDEEEEDAIHIQIDPLSFSQRIEPESWHNRGGNGELELVSELIDSTTKIWKTKIITTTFQMDIAQRILQIPLAITDYEDMQVWKGEHSGEFSVRNAYKLLQDASLDPSSYLVQAETKEFYKKLWNLQLP
ncbi:hypothetical protein Gotur_009847 [Gossypium turneri]